jgi:hypothetical protein
MSDLPITHVATTDLSDMLDPPRGRRMDMPGFDADFVDFPDYIIRITDQIWHERKVEKIYEYYGKDCIVHTQSGTIIGVEPVVTGTRATMVSFPDRVLDADNVIWSIDAPRPRTDKPVFYSSHLITSKMTNLGPSEFGPATGNKVKVRTIADCACQANMIFEEWLVRDYAAIVKHLGFDVQATAQKLAAEDVENNVNILSQHADNIARIKSSPLLSVSHYDVPEKNLKAFVTDYFKTIWQDQNFDELSRFYDFRVDGKYPGDLNLYGPDQIQPVLESVLCVLSDVKLSVDHVCEIPYLGDAKDVAVRWALTGRHSHDGAYGVPTGKDVYLLGMSQFRVMRGRIREDVTVWDDVAYRRMIEGERLRG